MDTEKHGHRIWYCGSLVIVSATSVGMGRTHASMPDKQADNRHTAPIVNGGRCLIKQT